MIIVCSKNFAHFFLMKNKKVFFTYFFWTTHDFCFKPTCNCNISTGLMSLWTDCLNTVNAVASSNVMFARRFKYPIIRSASRLRCGFLPVSTCIGSSFLIDEFSKLAQNDNLRWKKKTNNNFKLKINNRKYFTWLCPIANTKSKNNKVFIAAKANNQWNSFRFIFSF